MLTAQACCAYCFTVCATGEMSVTATLGSRCSPVASSCRHTTAAASTSATAMRRLRGYADGLLMSMRLLGTRCCDRTRVSSPRSCSRNSRCIRSYSLLQ